MFFYSMIFFKYWLVIYREIVSVSRIFNFDLSSYIRRKPQTIISSVVKNEIKLCSKFCSKFHLLKFLAYILKILKSHQYFQTIIDVYGKANDINKVASHCVQLECVSLSWQKKQNHIQIQYFNLFGTEAVLMLYILNVMVGRTIYYIKCSLICQ